MLDVSQIEECDGRIYAATDAGLATSDDAGETWSIRLTSSSELLSVACRGDLVLAMDQALRISRSDDRGEDWSDFSEGLEQYGAANPYEYLHDVVISADGRMAWLAWRKRGLFLRAL